MPYPNQHAAHIADVAAFDKDSIRTEDKGDGVSVIMGKRTGSQTMEPISYRFDKDKFSPDEARAWLEEHKISVKTFEPASEDQAADPDRKRGEGDALPMPDDQRPKDGRGRRPAPFAVENAGAGVSFEVSALTAGIFPGSINGKPADVPVTDKLLDHAVKGTNALIKAGKLSPPCTVGHGKDQEKLEAIFPEGGVPALGRIENLRREGEKVVFAIKGVSEQFADYVRRGIWRPVSADLKRDWFDPVEGTHYPMLVVGLAWLGASSPAVPIHEIFGLSEVQLAEFNKGQMITIDLESPQGDGHAGTDNGNPITGDASPAPTKREPTVKTEGEMTEEQKVALAAAEETARKATEETASIRTKMLTMQLNALVKDRRIKPADVETHLKLTSDMSDENAELHIEELGKRPQYDDETKPIASTKTPEKTDALKGGAKLMEFAQKHVDDKKGTYREGMELAAERFPDAEQAMQLEQNLTKAASEAVEVEV